jgi:hypothetical protein
VVEDDTAVGGSSPQIPSTSSSVVTTRPDRAVSMARTAPLFGATQVGQTALQHNLNGPSARMSRPGASVTLMVSLSHSVVLA